MTIGWRETPRVIWPGARMASWSQRGSLMTLEFGGPSGNDDGTQRYLRAKCSSAAEAQSLIEMAIAEGVNSPRWWSADNGPQTRRATTPAARVPGPLPSSRPARARGARSASPELRFKTARAKPPTYSPAVAATTLYSLPGQPTVTCWSTPITTVVLVLVVMAGTTSLLSWTGSTVQLSSRHMTL